MIDMHKEVNPTNDIIYNFFAMNYFNSFDKPKQFETYLLMLNL